MAMMYLMPPGVGSVPSAALSSSESGTGSTGSPFRNLGDKAGLDGECRGGAHAKQADPGWNTERRPGAGGS